MLTSSKSQSVVRQTVQGSSFEERVFNSSVSLKVAISQYAMHLSVDERYRLFKQLDSILNTDDWHEDDKLPAASSFQDFLKWMIYSKYFKCTCGLAHSTCSVDRKF